MRRDKCSSVKLLLAVGEGLAQSLRRREWLDEWGGEIISVGDPVEVLRFVRNLSPALILISSDHPCDGTVELVGDIRAVSADVPVVVVSENGGAEDASGFIHAGASDYIAGLFDKGVFIRLIEGLRFEDASHSRRRRRLFCDASPQGVEVVGRSPGIAKCLEMVRLVSESRCNPILILGETGTGKELIARSAHWWRYGDFEQFIAVNCATLTANLMASELFGHVKGAFTGADREKKGLFEEAEDGSIFLDEISEMPLDLQTQLLRVVQEGAFRKVGATRDTKCNATILASSNKDLLKEVETGGFRQDLYYRLAVLPIVVPALRGEDRREDIGLLAEYFLESSRVSGPNGVPRLGQDARRVLMQYHWPGNVRELRNVIERAIILERTDEISPSSIIFDQQIERTGSVGIQSPQRPQQDFSLEAAEREFIQRALEKTGWQRTRAASLLGITRATLYAKLKRYDIKAPDSSPDSDSSGQQDGQKDSTAPSETSQTSEKRTIHA